MPKRQRQSSKSAKFKKTKRKPSKNAPPIRQPNQQVRTREYLSTQEIDLLYQAAKSQGRNPNRDATLILIMFRHALRVSEVVSLRWTQVDLKQGLLHVKRVKNGMPSTHPIRGKTLRALRQLK